jgi:predicted  nucleic acid-binding Zn-ribbon protein
MVEERDDLMLKMLRDIRVTLDEHSGEFKALRKEMHDWHETIATATGFAMHANLRDSAIESEIEALKRRVETLEKAK